MFWRSRLSWSGLMASQDPMPMIATSICAIIQIVNSATNSPKFAHRDQRSFLGGSRIAVAIGVD